MSHSAAAPVLSLDVEHCAGKVAVVHCHGRLVAGATDVLINGVLSLIPENRRIVLEQIGLGGAGLLGLTHLLDVFTVIGESGVKFM